MNPRSCFRSALAVAGILAVSALSAQEPVSPATPPAEPATPPAAAPVPATDANTLPELTLDQCIRRALARNFDIEIQRLTPQIAKDAIDVARDPYQPVVAVTAATSGAHTADTVSTPDINSKSTNGRVGISQDFYTGTTVAVSSQLNRSEVNPTLNVYNPAYDADVTISVRQQLLRGFGTAINKAPVDRARIGFDRANLDFKARVLDIILSTENAYYNLVFAREQLVTRKLSLALAQRLSDEAQTRKSTGVATDLDVLQADVGVSNSRRGVVLAEQDVKDSEDALLAIIGQFELDTPLGPTHFTDVDEALPVFASSYQMAKQNQPDYLSAQAALEQAKIDTKIAKDFTKPTLSVGAAAGFNGTRATSSAAYDDTFSNRNNNWQVDLALTYPWGQVGDKARYRQSLATLTQTQTGLRKLEQTIEVQVRTAVRAVETNVESVKISIQSRELSLKQYQLEKAKFDAGRSTSYRVLQTQTDLETARVAELQAKVSLRNAISALHRLEGSSLQRYNIALE
ncbi:MAG TPA: TolC family protein [Candidatus Didemnitutus sp.]|nr:TolC family protein [Candidatus Didemnitutus sp.]